MQVPDSLVKNYKVVYSNFNFFEYAISDTSSFDQSLIYYNILCAAKFGLGAGYCWVFDKLSAKGEEFFETTFEQVAEWLTTAKTGCRYDDKYQMVLIREEGVDREIVFSRDVLEKSGFVW